MTAIDPTVVIERMARRLRSQGVANPVAGAVSVAARGHVRMAQPEFAAAVGLPVELVRSAETGVVPFGELPASMGEHVGATGADLLALADLEAVWRNDPPIRPNGP